VIQILPIEVAKEVAEFLTASIALWLSLRTFDYTKKSALAIYYLSVSFDR
jgi:hypothetical protein